MVAENEPGDFTFSWEIKSTIKSIDYDPFLEAQAYEDETADKIARKAEKDAEKQRKIEEIAQKRAKKLKEIAERQGK